MRIIKEAEAVFMKKSFWIWIFCAVAVPLSALAVAAALSFHKSQEKEKRRLAKAALKEESLQFSRKWNHLASLIAEELRQIEADRAFPAQSLFSAAAFWSEGEARLLLPLPQEAEESAEQTIRETDSAPAALPALSDSPLAKTPAARGAVSGTDFSGAAATGTVQTGIADRTADKSFDKAETKGAGGENNAAANENPATGGFSGDKEAVAEEDLKRWKETARFVFQSGNKKELLRFQNAGVFPASPPAADKEGNGASAKEKAKERLIAVVLSAGPDDAKNPGNEIARPRSGKDNTAFSGGKTATTALKERDAGPKSSNSLLPEIKTAPEATAGFIRASDFQKILSLLDLPGGPRGAGPHRGGQRRGGPADAPAGGFFGGGGLESGGLSGKGQSGGPETEAVLLTTGQGRLLFHSAKEKRLLAPLPPPLRKALSKKKPLFATWAKKQAARGQSGGLPQSPAENKGRADRIAADRTAKDRTPSGQNPQDRSQNQNATKGGHLAYILPIKGSNLFVVSKTFFKETPFAFFSGWGWKWAFLCLTALFFILSLLALALSPLIFAYKQLKKALTQYSLKGRMPPLHSRNPYLRFYSNINSPIVSPPSPFIDAAPAPGGAAVPVVPPAGSAATERIETTRSAMRRAPAAAAAETALADPAASAEKAGGGKSRPGDLRPPTQQTGAGPRPVRQDGFEKTDQPATDLSEKAFQQRAETVFPAHETGAAPRRFQQTVPRQTGLPTTDSSESAAGFQKRETGDGDGQPLQQTHEDSASESQEAALAASPAPAAAGNSNPNGLQTSALETNRSAPRGCNGGNLGGGNLGGGNLGGGFDRRSGAPQTQYTQDANKALEDQEIISMKMERLTFRAVLEKEAAKLKERYPGFSLQTKLKSNISLWFFAPFMRKILCALLLNAIEAMGGKAKQIVKVTSQTEEDFFVFTVEDKGSGLTNETASKAFSLYFSTKSQLGVGLNMAETLILANDGALELLPGEKGGAKALVKLPLNVFLKNQSFKMMKQPAKKPAPSAGDFSAAADRLSADRQQAAALPANRRRATKQRVATLAAGPKRRGALRGQEQKPTTEDASRFPSSGGSPAKRSAAGDRDSAARPIKTSFS